jgi:hypothetical protein
MLTTGIDIEARPGRQESRSHGVSQVIGQRIREAEPT